MKYINKAHIAYASLGEGKKFIKLSTGDTILLDGTDEQIQQIEYDISDKNLRGFELPEGMTANFAKE